jgi:hypothetical protein
VTEPVVREYLLLGLRFGRLVDGYVDCWTGDPELARQVDGEPRPDPAGLARQAAELSRALADSGLAEERQCFLAAQLRALACAGRKLAGEPIPFLAEVEEYFDVRIGLTDPARYEALHDELARLLPGPGTLHERLVAFRDRERLRRAALGPAIHAVSAGLRARLGPDLGLPETEEIEYVLAEDRPWNAFNEYLGGYRSRITLNVDAGHWTTGLAIVATHEAYPGHHAEHCLKERGLVADRGHAEHTIALVNTPQCLLAEGTAELGLVAGLGEGWGSWTEEVLRTVDVHVDGARSERVDEVMQALTEARQDAAILFHDRGRSADEVVEFLGRWMLVDTSRATQALRFLSDPLWRAYITTYVEGRRLVGRWLAAGPPDEPVARRHRRLLADQLLPATLRAELAVGRLGASL